MIAIVVLAELEEGYDSMPELEFDSESEFTVGVGVEITDNFGEGAHRRRFFKIKSCLSFDKYFCLRFDHYPFKI